MRKIIWKWLLHVWYIVTLKFKTPKIVVTQAILTGDGSFVDIRYWLSRPDKLAGRNEIILLEEITGKSLSLARMPKYGLVRTRHTRHQSTGVLLFHNKESIIKSGSIVTLIFGNFKTENIRIK